MTGAPNQRSYDFATLHGQSGFWFPRAQLLEYQLTVFLMRGRPALFWCAAQQLTAMDDNQITPNMTNDNCRTVPAISKLAFSMNPLLISPVCYGITRCKVHCTSWSGQKSYTHCTTVLKLNQGHACGSSHSLATGHALFRQGHCCRDNGRRLVQQVFRDM